MDQETGRTSPAVRLAPERSLTYRFFDLTYSQRMQVVSSLGLIEDTDESVREEERYKRYFQRAKEKMLLADLRDEVDRIRNGTILIANPLGKESEGNNA